MCAAVRSPERDAVHRRRTILRSFPRKRESTSSCPGRAKRDLGSRAGSWVALSRRRAEAAWSARPFPGQWELALLQDAALATGARAAFSGRIAQLVEQLTLNQRVPGSSPGAPTNKINHLQAEVALDLPQTWPWEGHGKMQRRTREVCVSSERDIGARAQSDYCLKTGRAPSDAG
jgi:hypothetical protein